MFLLRWLQPTEDIPTKSHLGTQITFSNEWDAQMNNYTLKLMKNCTHNKDPMGKYPSYRRGHIALADDKSCDS